MPVLHDPRTPRRHGGGVARPVRGGWLVEQAEPATPVGADEIIYLVGHASLKDYLGFLSTESAAPWARNPQRASDAGRAAREHLKRLEEQEAGCADTPPVLPVSPLLEPLVAQVRADP